jgi:hypothetical protein
MAPDFYVPSTNQFIMAVHSWLIRTPTITSWSTPVAATPRTGRARPIFISSIRRISIGFGPRASRQKTSTMSCAHISTSIIGWNTRLLDGRWAPTFPNAKYVFSSDELELLGPLQNSHLPEEPRDVFADTVLPVIAAKQDHVVSMTDQLGDNLLIETAPGHSPGQTMLRLLSDQEPGPTRWATRTRPRGLRSSTSVRTSAIQAHRTVRRLSRPTPRASTARWGFFPATRWKTRSTAMVSTSTTPHASRRVCLATR